MAVGIGDGDAVRRYVDGDAEPADLGGFLAEPLGCREQAGGFLLKQAFGFLPRRGLAAEPAFEAGDFGVGVGQGQVLVEIWKRASRRRASGLSVRTIS